MYLFILFLAPLGLHCHARALASCCERGLLSSCGAWASHCGGFSCCRASALGHTGSVVVAHRLSCPTAHGIFPDQGSNRSLALAGRFFTTGPQGMFYPFFFRFFSTLWAVPHQAPLSIGFSRQEYWGRLPFPPPGDLPNPGIKPMSFVSCIGMWVLYQF